MGPIQILYEDDALVVVNKPAGVLVVHAPGRRGKPTLGDGLSRQLGARAFALHRLDEDVTGALAFARSDAARGRLEPLFRQHRTERVYLALTARMPSPAAGRIESSLAEGPDGRVRVVTRGGERAVTHYRTLERRPRGALVECRLETGRRNQIRVHLAELGCPIQGDRKYGDRASRSVAARVPRVMLHAWKLRLDWDGREIRVEAPPPEPDLLPGGAARG